jgi:penicillin amidase
MLWLRILADGRTAEFLGENGLEADRLARVIGFRELAEAQLPNLPKEVQSTLAAYAAGINARIERIEAGDAGLPAVVARLDVPLEPWLPADSLAVLKLYSWSLGQSLDATLLLSDVMQHVGAGAARPFFPGGRATEPPAAPQRTAHREAAKPVAAGPLRQLLGLRGPSIGSSAWVVGGRHTESGLPILMADAHLAATAPPYLHVDRLRAGSFDVAGAMLPGVPVFWTGRNRSVAWGAVSAPAVVTDLYSETVDLGDEARYHDGVRWRRLPERLETLKVRGGEDVELRVHSTRHGPLLPEQVSAQPLSVAWVGARVEGPSGIASLLAVARAADADAVVEALKRHHEPALLLIYADDRGEAGLQMAGWIPSRSLSAELMPLPGRARWYEWRERVPYKAMPRARLEDGKGWLVAADRALDSRDPDHSIDWLWRSGHRSKRIEALLREAVAKGPLDLRGLSRLHRDVRDPRAEALVRDVLELVAGDDAPPLPRETRELIDILSSWDGRVTADSVGATAYHMFSLTLTDMLLKQQLGDDLLRRYLALPQADPERVAQDLVRQARNARGRQRQRWEPVVAAIRTSLREAWLRLSYDLGANRRRWTWGRLHALKFRPFASVPGVRLRDAGLASIPYEGNGNTISSAAYDPSSPFEVRVASTLRFGVDAAALDQGLVSLAPGQSEHPGHPHYDDGLPGWRSGEGDLLASGRLRVEESSVARLTLDPVR